MNDSWSLVAHTRAELGVGEAARRLNSLMLASGLESYLVSLSASASRQKFESIQPHRLLVDTPNLISGVNPDQLGVVLSEHSEIFRNVKRHVGFWAWELEAFPEIYNSTFSMVDEVWTISEFCKSSISANSTVPVRAVALPVPIPSEATKIAGDYFGIPDNKFLVVASFDFFSDVRRKNPSGAIEAFKLAFQETDEALLVVKSINGDAFAEDRAQLLEMADGRKDIIFLDSYLNHYENQALLEVADVFLSLHRAEGYGINMADAMARGTAVIATGYSGNLDFMDENSSILVPHSFEPVKRYAGLRIESRWAEPDVDFAADSLRRLYRSEKLLSEFADAGRKKIMEEHSLKAAVSRFRSDFCA